MGDGYDRRQVAALPPWPTRRQANLLLLAGVVVALITGTWLFGAEEPSARPLAVVHGGVGIMLLVLSPTKRRTVAAGLPRRRRTRAVSLALLGAVLVTLGTGMAHSAGARDVAGWGYPVMHVHVIAAITTGVLAVWHAIARPARPVRADASRRSLLKMGSVGAVAAAGYLVLDQSVRRSGLPGAVRRGTGSHELASFQPSRMPGTIWFTDTLQRLDPATHRVDLGGERTVVAADLQGSAAATWTEALDCTTGWYSVQQWTGVPLGNLLGAPPDDAGSVLVVATTGYSRRFPVGDLEHLLLATRVGGQPLAARHGGPVRLVARGRRGFWWVKWVATARYDPGPHWAQPPFPLT